MRDESYWALSAADDLLPKLEQRRERFLDLMDDVGLYERARCSLALYHGNGEDDPHRLHEPVRFGGRNGERILTKFNAFRASLSLLKTYVTSARVEWDSIAKDRSADSISSAKRTNKFLDGLISDSTTGLESSLSQAVEDALITSCGWHWSLWDLARGEDLQADIDTGIIYKSGALCFVNPTLTDVSFDPSARDPQASRWLLARRRENLYDLAADFPKLKDEIFHSSDTKYDHFDISLLDENKKDLDDFGYVYYFYLRPSPAAPMGRFVRYTGKAILEDLGHLPGGAIPIHRLVPAQLLYSPFGFTNAFSCEAPQRLLDALISTIATNQNALGTKKIWKRPGDPINRATLETGVSVIECETEPKGISLDAPDPELYKSVDLYLSFLERFSGVNATAHGQPVREASGAALAFIEQRVSQASADLTTGYDLFLSSVANTIVRLVDEHAPEQHGFGNVDRISIVRGNPLLRTLAGRVQVGEILMGAQAADPDQFLTLIQTGSLDKITESKDNQLELIRQENDAILRGENSHAALSHHNHVMHIKQHAAIADSPAARQDENISKQALAACLQHKQQMLNPEVQLWQTLLYNTPMPAQAPAPGGPGQPSPPAPVGRPSPARPQPGAPTPGLPSAPGGPI